MKLLGLDPETDFKRIRGLEGFRLIPYVEDILIIDSFGVIQILGFRQTRTVGSYSHGIFIISETKSQINDINFIKTFPR